MEQIFEPPSRPDISADADISSDATRAGRRGTPLRPPIGAVTVFDLDRTLTRTGTYSPFLIHAAWRIAPWRLALLPIMLGAMIAYKLGAFSRKRLKQVMQRLMLGPRLRASILGPVVLGFARHQRARNMYDQGIALVARERREGRIVVLATAAPRFYAHAIAAEIGIDHVVATEAVWDRGTLLARIDGENCYGAMKTIAIQRHLDACGIPAGTPVRFYSDDRSDLATFEWSQEPIAVNPSRKLAAIAAARGWQMLEWRRGTPGSRDRHRENIFPQGRVERPTSRRLIFGDRIEAIATPRRSEAVDIIPAR